MTGEIDGVIAGSTLRALQAELAKLIKKGLIAGLSSDDIADELMRVLATGIVK